MALPADHPSNRLAEAEAEAEPAERLIMPEAPAVQQVVQSLRLAGVGRQEPQAEALAALALLVTAQGADKAAVAVALTS